MWHLQAVRLACNKIVKALQPVVEEAKPGASWEDIIAAAQGNAYGLTPTKVDLQALLSGGQSSTLESCSHLRRHFKTSGPGSA